VITEEVGLIEKNVVPSSWWFFTEDRNLHSSGWPPHARHHLQRM